MQPLPLRIRALPWAAAALLGLPLGLELAGTPVSGSFVVGSIVAGTGLLGYWVPLMAHRRHVRAGELREE
jgi:hypothetical protein